MSDASAIEGLIEALAIEVPDLAVEMPDLADQSLLVVVAEKEDNVVGCLVARLALSAEKATCVVLESVFVVPEHRGESIGSGLVSRFSDWAIELDCGQAHAQAPISAPRAQHFLQQCGFNVRSVGRVQIVQAGTERFNVNDEEPWYSVRCHFALKDNGPFDYEERITLWQSDSHGGAIKLAEDEALSYAADNGYRYLKACNCYHLSDTGFAIEGKEIYSEMRKSDLEPDAYLDRYFFTGRENGS